MRKLLGLCLICVAVAMAQETTRPSKAIPSGASLPAHCAPASNANLFFLTVGQVGLYQCRTTDTWTIVPTNTGGTATWGNITGALSGQTDLAAALNSKATVGAPVIVTYSGSPTFDLAQGTVQKLTLTGSVNTPVITGVTAGSFYTILLCQNATGGFGFTWPSSVHGGMSNGLMPNKCSAQVFVAADTVNLFAVTAGVINQ